MSVSLFLFPCSKGQVVRAYLDTIYMTLHLDSRLCILSFSMQDGYTHAGLKVFLKIILTILPPPDKNGKNCM